MFLLAYVTLPASEDALELARKLVEKGVAAGVNIVGGAHSVYRWRGKICEADERLLFAQVSREKFEEFKAAVLEFHCHVVPCVIAMPVELGHQPFLDWISASCNGNLPCA